MRSDFSLSEIRILMSILFNNKKTITGKLDKDTPKYISEWAKKIKILPSNPYFINVIKFLKANNAIKETETIGSIQKIEINNDKIKEIISNQNIFILFNDYFKFIGLVFY